MVLTLGFEPSLPEPQSGVLTYNTKLGYFQMNSAPNKTMIGNQKMKDTTAAISNALLAFLKIFDSVNLFIIIFLWCPWRDSNPQHSEFETDASTNWTTWACYGALGQIRTDNPQFLRLIPLPIGLLEH